MVDTFIDVVYFFLSFFIFSHFVDVMENDDTVKRLNIRYFSLKRIKKRLEKNKKRAK